MMIRRRLGLMIDSHNLLSRCVRHAGEDARFCDRGVALIFQYSTYRNAFVPKVFNQQPSGFVVPYYSHWQYVDSQVGKIIDGIRPASGKDSAFAMLQDQDRGLARNARDLPEHKLIRNQVSEDGYSHLGEGDRKS